MSIGEFGPLMRITSSPSSVALDRLSEIREPTFRTAEPPVAPRSVARVGLISRPPKPKSTSMSIRSKVVSKIVNGPMLPNGVEIFGV